MFDLSRASTIGKPLKARCEQFAEEVFIRKITLGEQEDFARMATADPPILPTDANRQFLEAFLGDENNKRLVKTDEDRAALADLPIEFTAWVLEQGVKYNGLNGDMKAQVEDIQGK